MMAGGNALWTVEPVAATGTGERTWRVRIRVRSKTMPDGGWDVALAVAGRREVRQRRGPGSRRDRGRQARAARRLPAGGTGQFESYDVVTYEQGKPLEVAAHRQGLHKGSVALDGTEHRRLLGRPGVTGVLPDEGAAHCDRIRQRCIPRDRSGRRPDRPAAGGPVRLTFASSRQRNARSRSLFPAEKADVVARRVERGRISSSRSSTFFTPSVRSASLTATSRTSGSTNPRSTATPSRTTTSRPGARRVRRSRGGPCGVALRSPRLRCCRSTRPWAERTPNAAQSMTSSRFRHAQSAIAEPLSGR